MENLLDTNEGSLLCSLIRTYVNLYFHVINDEAVKILGNSEERDMCCFPFMRTIPLLLKLIVTMSFRVLEQLYTTISNAMILLVLRSFSSKKSFLLLSISWKKIFSIFFSRSSFRLLFQWRSFRSLSRRKFQFLFFLSSSLLKKVLLPTFSRKIFLLFSLFFAFLFF